MHGLDLRIGQLEHSVCERIGALLLSGIWKNVLAEE